MVPRWFRAFRLGLVSNDKTAHRASPTASEYSGMVPRWSRAFRLHLASTDETSHRVSPTTSYGFGMVPRWFRAFRLGLVSSDKTAHRASPTASEDSGMVPPWCRAFRLQLASTNETAHRVSPTTSYGSNALRVLPRRSGPKRLGCKRCRVALTTRARSRAFAAVPHPRLGRRLSTLVMGSFFDYDKWLQVLAHLAGRAAGLGGTR